MNPPVGQVQARNVQTSAIPAERTEVTSVSTSEAAAILARARAAKQAEAAAQLQEQAPVEAEPDEVGVSEVEEQGAEEIEATDEDAGDTQPDAPEEEVFYELDGEEIPVEEIRRWREAGLRTEDYTRKTQVLSQREQAVSTMGVELDRYAHGLRRLFESQVMGLRSAVQKFENEDWVALANDAPKYNQRKAQFEVAKGRLQQAQQQFHSFLSEFDEIGKRAIQMKAQAALPALKERIKGWNDGLYATLAEYAVRDKGADPDTISKVTDPWFWDMVHDSYVHRKAQSALKQSPQKIRRGPTVTPSSAGAARPAASPTATVKSAETAARQATGIRSQTAAAVDVLRARREAQQRAPTGRRR